MKNTCAVFSKTLFRNLLTCSLLAFLFLSNNSKAQVPDYAWREPVNLTIESEHPYADNTDQRWTINSAGARYLRINFSYIDLEPNYDHVYVYDQNGRQVAHFSGTYNNGAVVELAGTSAEVRLTSDSSVTRNGFEIFSYQVSAWPR